MCAGGPARTRAGAADSIARVIDSWHTSRPDLDVDPIAITARLARLNQTLGAQLEQVFASHHLTGADFAVLATMVRLGATALSQTQLMTELNLTAGTISVRVDRLVRDGLVERRRDESDRRGWQVTLTRRGRAVFEACAPDHLANAARLINGLSAREREELAALLGKLLRSLE